MAYSRPTQHPNHLSQRLHRRDPIQTPHRQTTGSGFTQTEYDSKNSANYPKVAAGIEKIFQENLQNNLLSSLNANQMAKGLIDKNSSNHMTVDILEYGLRRNDDSPFDAANFALYIKSNANIIDATGKTKLDRNYNTYSNKAGTLDMYLNDSEFVNQVVKNAQDKLASQLAIELYVMSMKH